MAFTVANPLHTKVTEAAIALFRRAQVQPGGGESGGQHVEIIKAELGGRSTPEGGSVLL